MKPILLAFSFIRVPRLFISLLLWPLLIGAAMAMGQVILSTAYMKFIEESAEDFQERVTSKNEVDSLVRSYMYVSEKPLAGISLCRWSETAGVESPPNSACSISKFDIVIQVENPDTYDASKYLEFFNGSTQRIHLCKECTGSIVLRQDGDEIRSDVLDL